MRHGDLTVNGTTFSISNWSDRTGVKSDTIRDRLNRGWTPAQAVGIDPPPKRKTRQPWIGPVVRPNNLDHFEPIQFCTIPVIDHAATGAEVRRIRRQAGKTIYVASASLGIAYDDFRNLEVGLKKWTVELLDRFNEVAKGWVKNGFGTGSTEGTMAAENRTTHAESYSGNANRKNPASCDVD